VIASHSRSQQTESTSRNDRFTEGFDTVDLNEAKALLEEL